MVFSWGLSSVCNWYAHIGRVMDMLNLVIHVLLVMYIFVFDSVGVSVVLYL